VSAPILDEPFEWRAGIQLAVVVTGPTSRVIVTVLKYTDADTEWFVGAVESPLGADILEDHAHKIVGKYKSLTEALAAGESFGRAWLKGFKATKMDACACEEIEP
jgi:hypothetical protein